MIEHKRGRCGVHDHAIFVPHCSTFLEYESGVQPRWVEVAREVALVRRVLVRRSPNHQGTRATPPHRNERPAHKRRPKATGAVVPDPSGSCGPRERTSTCVSPPRMQRDRSSDVSAIPLPVECSGDRAASKAVQPADLLRYLVRLGSPLVVLSWLADPERRLRQRVPAEGEDNDVALLIAVHDGGGIERGDDATAHLQEACASARQFGS